VDVFGAQYRPADRFEKVEYRVFYFQTYRSLSCRILTVDGSMHSIRSRRIGDFYWTFQHFYT